MTAGGFSAEKPADDEIRALFEVDSIRFSTADKLGQAVDSLVVISYQTQVVAGINYRVKAVVNGSTDVIIAAFKPLPFTGLPLQILSVTAA